MFGFGHGPELIIILVIALIVLGPGKIPEVAQMLGKGIRELRQASADLQKTFDVNELMNPTPAPPPATPPVAASPSPLAATETILPPAAEAPVKPKRTRKRTPTATADVSDTVEPQTMALAAAVIDAEAAPPANGSTPPARRAPRRRPSKKDAEAVSIDAPA
jgi:sec-independent protein translocase protein TatB